MTELEQLLTKIGLTKTEAQVYLTGLHYRNISVGELAKQTLVKRPTLYHALATLSGKGLASKYGTKMRMRFTMTPPAELKNLFIEQKKQLIEQERIAESLIPLLQPHGLISKEDQLELSHFEGITGVKTAINMALYCRSKRWEIIAPSKNFFSEFEPAYREYYLKTRKERGIIARSLWEDDFLKRKKKLGPEEMKERNPRILPAVMHGRFKDVLIIFDNKVLIIPSVKKLSAILIASQEVSDTFTALFEGLWQSSKPYKKIMPYIVYILRCQDGSLYTGITNDLVKRLAAHKNGTGAKYTRAHKPDRIMHTEKYRTKGRALKREIEIKNLSRAQKEKIFT